MDIQDLITVLPEMTQISVLEAVMLICFGMSWPISVIKVLRTKRVEGKSPLFMVFVAIGYVSGILHKILFSCDYLIALYAFNLSMILTDLYLYSRYNFTEMPMRRSELNRVETPTQAFLINAPMEKTLN